MQCDFPECRQTATRRLIICARMRKCYCEGCALHMIERAENIGMPYTNLSIADPEPPLPLDPFDEPRKAKSFANIPE
jgi:hypothetical protein